MLHDVDQSLKNMLVAEFKRLEQPLITGEDQIVVGAPSTEDAKPKKPWLNLFLHDVHESPNFRNFAFENKPTSNEWEVGKSLKPTHLNVSYVITAHAEDAATEHRLLGETLAVLMRHPFVAKQHLVGSLIPFEEDAMKLSIAQRDHFAHGDGAKVWQATGLPLRPFVGLVVAAMFDPFETRVVRRVREALFSLAQHTHPEGEQRQMEVHRVRVGAAGMVTQAATGEAMPDVKVSINGRPESTLTDATGVYFFRNLPTGAHEITFSKAGYLSQTLKAVTPPPGRGNEMELLDVQMKTAEDKDRQSTMSPEEIRAGTTLIGTLRFADGSPAAYTPVRIGVRTAVTDADGVYHFTHLQGPIREIVAEIPGEGEVTKPVSRDTATIELGKK